MTTTFVPGAGGGGTQYPDGTTQATPTGTAALAKNPSNVLKTLAVDAAGNLNVNLAAGSISGGNAAASPTGAAVPASADYTGFNSGGNLVGVSSTNPLPVSLANTGANATALKVDGSAVTQPVSGSVSVSNFPATQPVSGTVTANAGSNLNTSALALDATLTGGTQKTKLVDSGGTNVGAIKAASTAALATDPALVVAVSPNNSVAVTGTVTANAGTNLNTSALALDATLTGGTQKTKLVDSGGTNVGTIKAASTAALATDPALVVAVSPNNSVAVTGTVTTTPPANASTNVAQVAGTTADTNSGVKSAGTLRVVLATDQPQLTNKLLVTPDSVALPANQSVNVSQINAVTPLMGNGVTGTGSQRVTIASDNTAFAVNATLSAETTKVIGTARILGNGGATLDSTAAAGTAPTNALLTGNVFNTTVPAPTAGQAVGQQCDAAGSVYVNTEGRKTTYRMAVRGFTPVASASSPIFSIQGSASKTVRITHIKISWSCTTGTALPNDISLQKFSALTGGTTGNTPTGAKNDTNNAAQTAICLQYSAVPTTATVIGGISAVERMTWVTAGAAIQLTPPIEWVFGNLNEQGLVLRGTAEFYGVVLAAIGSTPVMSIWIEWTEE